MTPNDVFSQRCAQFRSEEERWEGASKRIALLRISYFLITLIAAIYFANAQEYGIAACFALGFLPIFFLMIRWHNRVRHNRDQNAYLSSINENELKRLNYDFQSFEGGAEYLSDDHPYTKDLDIFGKNSVFQLLNRAQTVTGKDTLAAWLNEQPAIEEVEARQEAIAALKNDLDFIQTLHASGMHFKSQHAPIVYLLSWIQRTSGIKSRRGIRGLSFVLSLIAMGWIAAIYFYSVPMITLAIPLLINGVVLLTLLRQVNEMAREVGKTSKTLHVYSEIIRQIEIKSFESPLLNQLKSRLVSEREKASKQIEALSRMLEFLNARANVFYMPINLLLMLDIHLLVRIEHWRSVHHDKLQGWFDSIGQTEALCSIAAFSFANPDYVTPEIQSSTNHFSAQEMGHPLIPGHDRVENSFELSGKGQIAIITGSNMSGKSTFLRTIGVNAVLAYTGASVCAKKMSLSLFQVFTSMRIEDNLEQHISSFYAELRRIKQLIDLLKSDETAVLYMLDEILKGTNSADRHIGAFALVKQLQKYNGCGLISTHDLELGNEAEALNHCKNYSFNSSIRNEKLHFDYKLTAGICHSLNASILMKKMGIEIN